MIDQTKSYCINMLNHFTEKSRVKPLDAYDHNLAIVCKSILQAINNALQAIQLSNAEGQKQPDEKGEKAVDLLAMMDISNPTKQQIIAAAKLFKKEGLKLKNGLYKVNKDLFSTLKEKLENIGVK